MKQMPNPLRTLPAFLLGAMLLAAGAAAGRTVDYRGRVKEKALLRPVAGALVKLEGSSLSATTDSAGRFLITGSLGAVPRRDAARWRLEGDAPRIPAGPAGKELAVEYFDASGKRLGARTLRFAPGSEGVHPLLDGRGGFSGFIRIAAGGEVQVIRMVSVAGHTRSIRIESVRPGATSAAAKRSAAGLTVSMKGLVTKTVNWTGSGFDIGDIILEYPPRTPGVGATMPYGAVVLLPPGGDSAVFRSWFEKEWIHKMNSWRQGQGLGTTPLLWKVTNDPDAAQGYQASLQPCCLPRNGSQGWGYDDIITKRTFKDYQVHVEFNMMGLPDGDSNTSGYCNSGIFLTHNHEVQVETPKANPSNYERLHGMGTLLDFKVPDKDMYPGAGKWQAYDITWRAPRGGEPGRVTVYWNGERVHNNVSWGSGNGNPVGFALQNELGSDVRYRNIWIKELDITTPATDFGF